MADPNRALKGGMMSFAPGQPSMPTAPTTEVPARPNYGTKTYPPTYFSNTRASMGIEPEAPESPSFDLLSKLTDYDLPSEPIGPPAPKKLKMTHATVPQPTENPHETPAMRQKTRPKRPTLNIIAPSSGGRHDSDDEDYIAPRTSSSQTQGFKRSNTPPAPSRAVAGTPNLDGAYRYPTNAYSDLSYSAWPTSADFTSTIDSNNVEYDTREAEIAARRHGGEKRPSDSSLSFKAPLPLSERRSNGDDAHAGDSNLVDLTTEADSKEGTKSIAVSVPEFDAYLATCDDEEFVDELNYPHSVAIAGIGDWMSTLERRMLREGVLPPGANSQALAQWEDSKWTEGTWINCDLRHYDLSKLGKFDVVLVDPPWRSRGLQPVSQEKTLSASPHTVPQYNTMSNEEVKALDVASLSDRGFLFLWTTNAQMQTAFECFSQWGYTYVDRITWVKKTARDRVFLGQGQYMLHSTEICLIGVKRDDDGNYLEVVQKVTNDIIFAQTQKRSQKPEALYDVIERMFPGAFKVELFARNHNIRKGWLSLGNQLGSHYNWAHDAITCDLCACQIPISKTRFKHRLIPNLDYCLSCFSSQNAKDPVLHAKNNFYFLENKFDEQVFHDKITCSSCGVAPLWGIRFCCKTCQNLNLCETCHDARFEGTRPGDESASGFPALAHFSSPSASPSVATRLSPSFPKHRSDHLFHAFEKPAFSPSKPAHHVRCASCLSFPIFGNLFRCDDCASSCCLCQKCFFSNKLPRAHLPSHSVSIVTESSIASSHA